MSAKRIFFSFLGAQLLVKQVHTFFRSILTAKPYWPPPELVVDHNSIAMSLANRYIVHTDNFRDRCTGSPELLLVLLFHLLHTMPIQLELLGNILDCGRATTPPDIPCKPLGKKGILRENGKFFLFHQMAVSAGDSTHLKFQVDAKATAGKFSNTSAFPVGRGLRTGSGVCPRGRRWRLKLSVLRACCLRASQG